jgi:hypothetical protein
MKKPNSNRLSQIEDELISRIIKESKKSKVDEWDQQVTLNAMPDDIAEEDVEEGNEFSGKLEKARKDGKNSFVVNGKKYPVKGKKKMDEGLYDVEDLGHSKFDYTEEEGFEDVDELIDKLDSELGEAKLSTKQKYIAKQAEPKNKIGANDFKVLRSKSKGQVSEGNAFGMALKNARDNGHNSFELNGKTYEVKEGKSTKKKKNNKWIQDAINKPKESKKKSEGDEKDSKTDLKTSKQVNLALNLKKMNESKIYLSENEMVELIEKLVAEERVKGLDVTIKNQKASKKENDDYLRSVTKKMKEYLRDGSKGDYEENPKNFPMGNGQIEKMKKMAYTPSEEVGEYIEDYAYPGQTNLVFDEIKPDDKKIEKYLKGDKTTGNAEVDEDGKSYGNVVPSKTGEKFMKNYKKNAYGKEQMNASYKRYPQDTIEVSGENTKSKRKQSSLAKLSESQIMEEQNNLIKEEFNKIQHLMGYNKKTQ